MNACNHSDTEIYLQRLAALERDALLATSLLSARQSVEAAHFGMDCADCRNNDTVQNDYAPFARAANDGDR